MGGPGEGEGLEWRSDRVIEERKVEAFCRYVSG